MAKMKFITLFQKENNGKYQIIKKPHHHRSDKRKAIA